MRKLFLNLTAALVLTVGGCLACPKCEAQCPGGNCGGSSVRLFQSCQCGPSCPAGGNCSPCLCASIPPVGKPQLSADGKYQWVGIYSAAGVHLHDRWVPVQPQYATGARRVVRYEKVCTGTGCKVIPVYE